MGSAFYRMDIVDIGKNGLLVAGIVLKGNVNGNNLVRSHADRLRNEFLGIGVKVLYELLETGLGIELSRLVDFVAGRDIVVVGVRHELVHQSPHVGESDVDTLVQECKLAHPAGESVVVIYGGGSENLRIRMESDRSSRVMTLAHYLDRAERLALGILLTENLALPVNLGHEFVGQCIHAGYSDSVETSGNLVAVLVELTSGVKHRENDLKG